MDVGLQMMFSSYASNNVSDEQVWTLRQGGRAGGVCLDEGGLGVHLSAPQLGKGLYSLVMNSSRRPSVTTRAVTN